MKKVLITLLLLMLFTSCQWEKKEYVIEEFQKNIKSWEILQDLAEINNNRVLPNGIYKEQLTKEGKYFKIGNIYLAFVYRNNINFNITDSKEKPTNFSWVIISKWDGEWYKFLEIKNIVLKGEKEAEKNNPYALIVKEGKIHLFVVDSTDTEIEEWYGKVKEFVSDDFWKTWELGSCSMQWWKWLEYYTYDSEKKVYLASKYKKIAKWEHGLKWVWEVLSKWKEIKECFNAKLTINTF